MPRRFLRLEAYTREDRNEMVRRSEDAIGTAGGWLVDVHLASNKSAVLRFELPLRAADAFRVALLATGLKPGEEGLAALGRLCEEAARSPESGAEEVAGLLSLFFVHDEPDLRRVIPAVPG
jgi:hypothetical protein